MDDGDSTYIAASDAAKGTMSCQGYPNLITASESLMESVLDTFEGVVEDQEWFRFLKTKYDSFNHLEEDGDGTVTVMTILSDEDMTLNTFETRYTYDTCKVSAVRNKRDGDIEENDTMLTDELDSRMNSEVVMTRGVEQEEVQGRMEVDTEIFEGIEQVREDSDNESDNENECKEKYDRHEAIEGEFHYSNENNEQEGDETIISEFPGEAAEDEEGHECEAEMTIHANNAEQEEKSHSYLKVELAQDGSNIPDSADGRTVSSIQSASSVLGQMAPGSSVCSILSFPTCGKQDSVRSSPISDSTKDEIDGTFCSSGLEMNFVPHSSPALSFHLRQNSNESKATQKSIITDHTAEISHATGTTAQDEDEAREVHANVEVVGIKGKRRFPFLRLWERKSPLTKITKQTFTKKDEKRSETPMTVPSKKMHKQPQVKFTKGILKLRPSKRQTEEKKLLKTTVIVTRNCYT